MGKEIALESNPFMQLQYKTRVLKTTNLYLHETNTFIGVWDEERDPYSHGQSELYKREV
jgi:hypothetical protein